MLSGIAYAVYNNFVKSQKAPRKARTKKVATPAASPVVPNTKGKGPGQYEDEWIPEHHKKKPTVGAGLPSSDSARRRRGLAGTTDGEGESGTDGNASAASVGGTPRRRSARSKR